MGKNYTFRQSGNVFVVSVNNHCEMASAISDFCNDLDIRAGEISGLGALDRATLRCFDPLSKDYVDKTFDEQMELANLTGNISTLDGQIYIHLHVVIGKEDYSAIAGHLMTARINGACELIIHKFDMDLPRRYNPEVGLNMYDF